MSFLGRHTHEDNQEEIPEDPVLLAAREKVIEAERAEIRAERASLRATGALAEARENVKQLEREAKL